MITNIYQGYSLYDSKIKRILNPEDTYVMVVFDTIKSRDLFYENFPKSLRVLCSVMSGHRQDEKTGKLATDENNRLIPLYYPFCSMRISGINEVTGRINETGHKRMNRFYDAVLKQYDSEGAIDLTGIMEKYALTKLP